MTPVTRESLLPTAAFVAQRRQIEAQVLAAKAARRLTVGEHFTFLFENRLTVQWQVQEMCRVEHITDDAAIQHELDTYNAILGGPDEIGATLLIEYTDPAQREVMLARLLGLQEHVFLDVGGERVRAVFDAEQWNERRISSVQFCRFRFSPAARAAMFDLSRSAQLTIDHPACTASAALPGAVRGALCEDLTG